MFIYRSYRYWNRKRQHDARVVAGRRAWAKGISEMWADYEGQAKSLAREAQDVAREAKFAAASGDQVRIEEARRQVAAYQIKVSNLQGIMGVSE